MEFQNISDLLADKDLKNPSFDFLTPDHELYDILLYQPSHEFEAQSTYLRSTDRELVKKKVSIFLEIAINKKVDLVITPEYSTPWDVISESIEKNNLPIKKNLWVLGCESIQPKDFQEKIAEHKQVEWIYDENLVERYMESENFLNPLCYIFKTKNNKGDEINIIVVQFKTHPLGGNSYERDNMISGNDIYVLANDGEDSITLRTFICSDVLGQELRTKVSLLSRTRPHLILHTQLNYSPCDSDFRNYRQELFRNVADEREVICLNWGREIFERNGGRKFGATALYSKINDINQSDLSDDRVNANHNLGLYYTWSEKKRNNYYFNFDEHVFYLRNTKASQVVAAGVMTKRTGPELQKTFGWDDGWVQVDQVQDGFNLLCENIENNHIDLETLKCDDNLTPIDKERLLTLTIGKAKGTNWYKVNKGEFFSVTESEYIKRFTFVHHPNENVIDNRKMYLYRFAKLENKILTNPGNFPKCISDLKDNCQIGYQSEDSSYNFNLYPVNDRPDTAKATGIYLDTTNKTDAEKIFNQIRDIFGKRESKNDNQNDSRIVVWYKDNNDDVHYIEPDSRPGPINKKKDRRSISRKAG